MKEVIITRPGKEDLDRLGIGKWPAWECDPSEFDWQYTDEETAYIINGLAVVTTKDGGRFEFKAGDMVKFPKGLKCHWKIIKRIEKVFKMG